jgi:hypothetical protein
VAKSSSRFGSTSSDWPKPGITEGRVSGPSVQGLRERLRVVVVGERTGPAGEEGHKFSWKGGRSEIYERAREVKDRGLFCF